MKFSIIAITIAASLVPGIMGHPVAPYVETKQLESPEIAKNDTMKPTWRTIWKRDDLSTIDTKNNTMKPTWRTIWKRDDLSTIDSKNNTMKPTWRTIWKREEPSTTIDTKNNTMKPTWRTIWKREQASIPGVINHPATPTAGTKHLESSEVARNNTMKPTWRLVSKKEQHTTRLY